MSDQDRSPCVSDLRLARHADIPVLQELIALSGRALSVGYYSSSQADAITRHVFGVDSQLVDDQTKRGPDPLLDPAVESARIRAFFVHPYHGPSWHGPHAHGRLRGCVEIGRVPVARMRMAI
ncbi:MAG: hypothetical protein AB7P31_14980 [Steroidobacteraceae bacterium]